MLSAANHLCKWCKCCLFGFGPGLTTCCFSPSCLQRLSDNQTAKSPTGEEIQDFLLDVGKEIMSKICAAGEQPSTKKPLPHGFVPMWSLDNARVHTSAIRQPYVIPGLPAELVAVALVASGLPANATKLQVKAKEHKLPADWYAEPRFYLRPPAWSPDLHKVIEHVHGIVSSAWKKQLMQMQPQSTIQEYTQVVKSIFDEKIKCSSVQKDILSLQDTFKQVIALGGAYPAKKYR